MTDDVLKDLRDISDPVERARRATEIIDGNTAVITEASAIRQEALEILRETMTHTEIARATRLTRARVSQLLASAMPERALLAPAPGPLTICVIQRRETEHGAAAVRATAIVAAEMLAGVARSYGISADTEQVPADGLVNLNRPNLAVLIGPRSSPLVAQAISADPAIRWQPDGNGNWYITDTQTGTEYHSEFDRGADPALPWPRTCYAHIGRVRRPDGQGNWLCLAGEHAPGVAGAVELFCRDIASLWEQAHRTLWSAIARVKAAENGDITDASLITQVYAQGRR
jgi:hypothetical protein